eukprot:TRINITY_DN2613_c0_g1_i1.p1 TRINITY_DN2613_c0_g1~~TRINITY_DN2613_c0_g1_i1.p1  ORF type:complete len:251 (-),score=84.74 TRINITY_DN2613_c0_g1_i1:464-1141(-)
MSSKAKKTETKKEEPKKEEKKTDKEEPKKEEPKKDDKAKKEEPKKEEKKVEKKDEDVHEDMSHLEGNAGESKSSRIPIECHHVKKGKYIMMKGRPCRIVDVATSKTGKHGHMKCNITGIDVLTGKKYTDMQPGHAVMTEFKIEKSDFQLLNIESDGAVTALDSSNTQKMFQIPPDSELFEKINADFSAGKTLNITVLKAPVEEGKDKFKDCEIVETYKEEKDNSA